MSRYTLKKKQAIKPEPFYDSVLIQKMTNQLMKKGNKTLARKILNQTLYQIEKKNTAGPCSCY